MSIEDKFWRGYLYLQARGLSLEERDEEIRKGLDLEQQKLAEIAAMLKFLANIDPERAERIRRELDERGRELQRQLDAVVARAQTLVAEPDDAM
jgi:hypothetical protein